jgi:hypothetical protein
MFPCAYSMRQDFKFLRYVAMMVSFDAVIWLYWVALVLVWSSSHYKPRLSALLECGA